MISTLTAGWRRRSISGECVFKDRQEAADVRVALAAAEVRRKLVEQRRAPGRTYGIKAVSPLIGYTTRRDTIRLDVANVNATPVESCLGSRKRLVAPSVAST